MGFLFSLQTDSKDILQDVARIHQFQSPTLTFAHDLMGIYLWAQPSRCGVDTHSKGVSEIALQVLNTSLTLSVKYSTIFLSRRTIICSSDMIKLHHLASNLDLCL